MIFSDLKSNVRKNLDDLGISFYNADDLNDAITDAYNDIVTRTQCIIKKSAGLSWIANLSYIDFKVDYGITDFMAVTAIFNNNTNMFLDDNLSLKQFNLIRQDWEINTGQPTNWAPHSFNRIAIFPRLASATGTFDLYYWALAPTIVDSDTPLVATDKQMMFEEYGTADLLEQAEEYAKALIFWNNYFANIEQYMERVKKLSKADLMLLA
jgi:hypothetical protein